MTAQLLAGYAPFIAAIGVMIAIGLLEVLTLLLGFSASEHAGNMLVHHFDIDHGGCVQTGIAGQFLGWLHVGRVPFLVLMVLLLTGFSISGLMLQSVLHLPFISCCRHSLRLFWPFQSRCVSSAKSASRSAG
ncbi:hypothetical protein ACLKMY_11525 [Paraburkholderia mimosarum]|uniref:hypothetical protein n=1 Tax=Paraburkholderia mimosarum TaxID=312026 RepID=UPI0039C49E5E